MISNCTLAKGKHYANAASFAGVACKSLKVNKM